YIIQGKEKIYFIFKKFFQYRSWEIARDKIISSEVKKGFFFDTIRIIYKEGGNDKMVSFTFLPTREPLVQRFSEELA
ncbi:MAG: hypothetical protein PHV06_10100, partial [bacterium]|nr:hypothetical protein [bacterium]